MDKVMKKILSFEGNIKEKILSKKVYLTSRSRADEWNATSKPTIRCSRGYRIGASIRVLSLSSRSKRRGLQDRRVCVLRQFSLLEVPSLFR